MNLNDRFSQRAQLIKPQLNLQVPSIQSEEQPQETDRFAQRAIELKQEFPEQENDLERDIERQQARMTSRGLETIGGTIGDLRDFTKSLLPESLGKGLFGAVGELFPTSKELKEKSQEITKGYTTPKNELEKFGDELIEDVTSMASPGAGKYNLARNIGIPIVANLAKEGVKYTGLNEGNQAASKVGTMLALDLIMHRNGGAKKFASSLFGKAESTIPKGQSILAKDLDKELMVLENEFKKGGAATSTAKALEKISEIRSDINKGNGKIDVSNLYQYRPKINELISELGGFDFKVNPSIRKKAISNLQSVKDKVINKLNSYGKHLNPEFSKYYQPANEAYAVYENSNKIVKALEKSIGTLRSGGAKILFGLGAPSAISTVLPGLAKTAAPIAIPLAIGYKGFKILNRVKNSPTLRKYYGDILTKTLAGNIPEATRNLKKLDNELLKEE